MDVWAHNTVSEVRKTQKPFLCGIDRLAIHGDFKRHIDSERDFFAKTRKVLCRDIYFFLTFVSIDRCFSTHGWCLCAKNNKKFSKVMSSDENEAITSSIFLKSFFHVRTSCSANYQNRFEMRHITVLAARSTDSKFSAYDGETLDNLS